MHLFKTMSRYLKKYKVNLLLFGIFLILATLSSFFVPKIWGDYIDSLVSYKDIWMNIFYAFIVIAVVETISSYLSRYLRNKIANRITLDMIKNLTSHIIKLPTNFFKEQEVMYLSNRVNSDSFNLGDFTLKIISDASINI